jgi:hypothetical protein
MRIALAALVGGIVVWMWSAIAHTVLPIGTMGLSGLPDEAPVVAALAEHVPEAGLYYFPDPGHHATDEEMEAWQERYATGPAGLLAYVPRGGEPMMPRQLVAEVVANVLAAGVAAWLATLVAGGYWRRVAVITSLPVFAWLAVSASYWIWYSFPFAYSTGEAIDLVVGFFLGGLVIAKLAPAAAPAAR